MSKINVFNVLFNSRRLGNGKLLWYETSSYENSRNSVNLFSKNAITNYAGDAYRVKLISVV